MGASSNFGGELGLVGLFDLGQLLMLNRATGCLAVVDGARKGYFYFRDGRIINAVDEDFREGEAAAFHLFTWRTGRFDFRPEPPGGDGLIDVGTEALMLEAARRMDEAGPGGEGAGEAGRLRERQGTMEALREAFTSVAREARGLTPAASAVAPAGQLDALRHPGDRLLFRPGRPARLRTHGLWRVARDAALSNADYEDLRARLLGPDGLEGPTDGPRCAVTRLADGRAFEVTLVAGADGESLWLRPADLEPPALEGASERLDAAFGARRALVVVGGEDPDQVSRLVHAMLAWRLGQGDSVLLAADHPGWHHDEGPGALMVASPAQLGAALAAMEPVTLVLDLTQAAPEGALEALDGVRHIVTRVPDTARRAMGSRWTERLAAADAQRATAHLSGAEVVCVRACAGSAEDRVGFEVLDSATGARERELLAEATSLADALDQRPRRAA